MDKETRKNKKAQESNEKFLVSVNNGYETDLVRGSLESAGIPFYTKDHSGPAGFARYDTKYDRSDVDFYVPENLFDRAKEALPPVEGAVSDTTETREDEICEQKTAEQPSKEAENPEEPPQPMSAGKRAILIIAFIAAICVVVFGIDTLMNYLRSLMGY